MAPRRKRDKLKEWLRGFFPPMKIGPQHYTGPGGFFNNAEGFILNDPIMTSVHVDNTTVINMQGAVTQIMNLLSQHIIRGAAHDSSARTPPPRCHPDTRVKLIARITAWFEGRASLKLLLWITGPAGVGKSAVVQTFAEYLNKSSLLGASVFISRPNKRNNPHGVFITVAYQLATRIEAYRDYVVEKISRDPESLSGNMQAQFTTFIVEPFVEKKIGAGGQRWGILLDGLDELHGEDAQCEIIQLVSTFAYEHHDAPLVWIIASRPESHISNTFEDDEVQRSCCSEYIPIDSTEACEDVERFLRSGFATTQKKFRHSVSSDWPSNTDFLELTAAASGLFVYAEVAMQFIRDSDHADPVSRFQALLSVINNSNAVPTNENPFVHLDALYREILSSIPSTQWPTAKRLLAFTIYGGETYFVPINSQTPHDFQTLRGMSILFGITKNVVYASLNKCRSVLKIPNWKVAHTQGLAFLHASLADHLRDSSRSGNFHVGQIEDVEEDMTSRLLEIWIKCSGHDIAISSIESTWRQYCSKLDDKSPSRVIAKVHKSLFNYMICQLCSITCRTLQNPAESSIHSQLRKVHMRKLCHFFYSVSLLGFVNHLMPNRSEAPPFRSLVFHSHNLRSNDIEVLREVQLKDLEFGQLDWKEMSPAFAAPGHRFAMKYDWMMHRPRSNTELKAFVSDLEALQKRSPELEVVIVGGVPKERVAAFYHPLIGGESADLEDFMYYVVPYPE